MQAKTILIIFVKAILIFIFTIVFTFIMALLLPPPKGTAFDGLEYILMPIYVSLGVGFLYFLVSVFYQKFSRQAFYLSLLICALYVTLLYLRLI